MTCDHEEKMDTNNNNRDTTRERPIWSLSIERTNLASKSCMVNLTI